MPNNKLLGYGKRYIKTFLRKFTEFLWQQIIVGGTLTALILWEQVHHGIITTQKVHDNVLAVLEPYLWLIGGALLWHLVRTAYLLYLEDQAEIERLNALVTPPPKPEIESSPKAIDLRGEILEIYFDKADDIPSFPSCTTILMKVQVVNHGPMEATITSMGLLVHLGRHQEIGELLTIVPASWRVKYRDPQYMHIVYIETPVEPLLGHNPQSETYRTAIQRVGWVAFKIYAQENIEFPNAEFTLCLVDSLDSQHWIVRKPQIYVKAGIFEKG
jgi:hypothetical protein